LRKLLILEANQAATKRKDDGVMRVNVSKRGTRYRFSRQTQAPPHLPSAMPSHGSSPPVSPRSPLPGRRGRPPQKEHCESSLQHAAVEARHSSRRRAKSSGDISTAAHSCRSSRTSRRCSPLSTFETNDCGVSKQGVAGSNPVSRSTESPWVQRKRLLIMRGRCCLR